MTIENKEEAVYCKINKKVMDAIFTLLHELPAKQSINLINALNSPEVVQILPEEKELTPEEKIKEAEKIIEENYIHTAEYKKSMTTI